MLTIDLSFHRDDSRVYPTGYWAAVANEDGSPQYDGVGLTPLDAVMDLAQVLHAATAEATPEGVRCT